MQDARAPIRALLLGIALFPTVTLALSIASQGCGPSATTEPDGGTGTSGTGGAMVVETLHPAADPLPGEDECTVTTTTGIPVSNAEHVPYCTPVAYATNPPSGGNHWATWAAFKEYQKPIPREVYVHDMEHGAVILTYRCASECPEVVKMLRDVLANVTPDPLCLSSPGGPAARVVITPDPELDTPIAAGAWGATYTATCIDQESLANFVARVYGKGPEQTCYPGKDFEDPNAGVTSCDGGGGSDGGSSDGGGGGA